MTGGNLLFCICCVAFIAIYYKFTTPEEREASAKRRHDLNDKILGGGFSIFNMFVRRLR